MNPSSKADGVYRVIHTADWHLGKTLCDRPRLEEHRRFLDFLLDTLREHAVDALLIAGDVFDSGNPPQSAATLYFDFLGRLHAETACAAVVTAGNHDAPSLLEAPRQVLKTLNVHIVGQWPGDPADAVVFLPSSDRPRLAVAAVPFLRDRDLRAGKASQTREDIERDLREGIQRCYAAIAGELERSRPPRVAAVAMGHLTVMGGVTSDSERDIHIGGLGAVSHACFPAAFAYVALGHLHRPQSVGGIEHIRYAGAPIPLSFGEANGAKTLRLLDFVEDRLVRNEEIAIPAARALIRVAAPFGELEARLSGLSPPPAELSPWVEVEVRDPPPGENLYEKVAQWLQGSAGELLKVSVVRGSPPDGLHLPDDPSVEEAQSLLNDPARVFERRLADYPAEALGEEEREHLRIAFQQLLEIHHEAGPEPVTTPVEGTSG